jgi:hypothetical protein
MPRFLSTLAALALLATPAMAQQSGGVLLPAAGAGYSSLAIQPGCPLAQTRVATATTRAFTPGGLAVDSRVVGGHANPGCPPPVVGIGIGAGVALGLAPGALAAQSIDVTAPKAQRATIRFGRAIGQAAAPDSAVLQNLAVH